MKEFYQFGGLEFTPLVAMTETAQMSFHRDKQVLYHVSVIGI